MTTRDPRDRLRDAAARRRQAIEAATETSAAIQAEREADLARRRSTPKTTAVPLPEAETEEG